MLQHQIKLILPLFIVLGLVIGCAGDEKSSDTSMDNNSSPEIEMQDQNTSTNNDDALQGNNPMQVVDENGEVVYHYVCPNGCEGGFGPGKAPCPVCGTMFEHNNRYHQYQQPKANTDNTPVLNQNQTQGLEAQQPPAQNAAGEYHYICPQGCAGGSATQGVCSNCGAELSHNAAYHN